MKPILTIIRDPSRAEAYDSMVRSAGVRMIQAEGALHALTQLERTEVSAIICEADMGEMSGSEFSSVVQAEERSGGVPVFILPDPTLLTDLTDLSAPAPSGPELMRQALQISGVKPDALPLPMNPALPAQLQGDLDQFGLSDLLGWVGEMHFDGHWTVRVRQAQTQETQSRARSAHLVMSRGDVIYAEFSGLVGKPALLALFQAITLHPDTTFRFYKSEQISRVRSSNLQQTTARLLIELAVDIDHSRVDQQPASLN